MKFWTVDMMIPALMIIVGWIFKTYTPKTINHIMGYRTSRSMASQEAWEYANRRFAELWFKWGIILVPIMILSRLITPKIFSSIDEENLSVINTWIGMIALIGVIPIVEKELGNKEYNRK